MSAETDRPARDAEATRERLLRAAQRRFVLFGYDRTTTREIAADARANLSLINRYFGGKRGLYEAATTASAGLLAGTPRAQDALASFLATMDPEAWPELGAHPMLLLLRDDGDAELQALRTAALELAAERLDLGGDGDPLPSQLALALLCGTLALRRLGLLEPLASADAAALEGPLRAALDSLRDYRS